MATIPLALYLWRRVHEIGVDSVMGVPGDFNLNFLDYVYEVPGLNFVGNSNELNAAYAADGYSRAKRVPGVIVTTHGVGELSALNGIACAASEHSPVIHVVGQTGTAMQKNNMMIHHSVGLKPDHQVFAKASKAFRCSEAQLIDGVEQAPAAIDKAIRDCVLQKQPVYIFFPIDMTDNPVPASLLDKKIDLSLPINKQNEDTVANAVADALYSSKKPAVLVDYLSFRFARTEAQALVDKLDLPHYMSHGTKGCVHESHPKYVGIYNGLVGTPGVSKSLETSDLVLALGWFESDLSSGGYSRKIPAENRIDLQPDHAVVRGKRYDGVYMSAIMTRLAAEIDASKLPPVPTPSGFTMPPAPDIDAAHLTHSQLWPKLASIFEEDDIVHTDTGTAPYGTFDIRMPRNVQHIYSAYWGSIGFSTPCAFGTDIALRDMHASGTGPRGRTVLITGDGSLMFTMQEISTMVMQKLPILIIILNNAGYTIERAIHGAHQAYNNIPRFDYAQLLPLFGAPDASTRYKRIASAADADAVLADKAWLRPAGAPHVLEIVLQPLDLPWKLAAALERREPGYLKRNGFPIADWKLVTDPGSFYDG